MLRRACVIVLLPLSSVFAASAVQDSANGKDKKALQGKWEVVSVTEEGKKQANLDKKMFFVFRGDDVFMVDGSKEKKFAIFNVNASKTPKVLEMKPVVKEIELFWIYDLNGNDLKLCGSADLLPKDFSSTKKDMQVLILFKRAKD